MFLTILNSCSLHPCILVLCNLEFLFITPMYSRSLQSWILVPYTHVFSFYTILNFCSLHPCFLVLCNLEFGRASPASLRCGPWARHIYPSLVLVQPRKTRPCSTERLLMGRIEWSSWIFVPYTIVFPFFTILNSCSLHQCILVLYNLEFLFLTPMYSRSKQSWILVPYIHIFSLFAILNSCYLHQCILVLCNLEFLFLTPLYFRSIQSWILVPYTHVFSFYTILNYCS